MLNRLRFYLLALPTAKAAADSSDLAATLGTRLHLAPLVHNRYVEINFMRQLALFSPARKILYWRKSI